MFLKILFVYGMLQQVVGPAVIQQLMWINRKHEKVFHKQASIREKASKNVYVHHFKIQGVIPADKEFEELVPRNRNIARTK